MIWTNSCCLVITLWLKTYPISLIGNRMNSRHFNVSQSVIFIPKYVKYCNTKIFCQNYWWYLCFSPLWRKHFLTCCFSPQLPGGGVHSRRAKRWHGRKRLYNSRGIQRRHGQTEAARESEQEEVPTSTGESTGYWFFSNLHFSEEEHMFLFIDQFSEEKNVNFFLLMVTKIK